MLFSGIRIVRIVKMQIYGKRVFLLFSTNSINDIDKNADENMAWTKDSFCFVLFGQIILGEIEITKI